MERIQYATLRTALRCRSSTSTNIILSKSRLCMLQHKAKYICNRFVMKNLSNRGSTLYNWFNRFHNSTTCSNLVRKSHYIDKLKENCSKRKKLLPSFYMNIIYSFQQYPLKPICVISSRMLRTQTPCSLLTTVTDTLALLSFLRVAVRMRCLVV